MKRADFVVLSAMRSGSNNLQDALARHPEIDCGGEVFNPAHVQIWSRLYQQERTSRWGHLPGAGPLFAAARWGKRQWPHAMLGLARRPWGKSLFGFRLLGNHIAHFGLTCFLDEPARPGHAVRAPRAARHLRSGRVPRPRADHGGLEASAG